MIIREFAEKLNLKVLVEGDLEREITGGYCGDLLSWVMGRAQSGDCWFTVMGNINAIAVSVLADCACIVLCENSTLDDDAKKRAEMQGVAILSSEENAYTLANKLGTISGVEPSTITSIFYGKSKNPGTRTILDMCQALNITLYDFFDDDLFKDIELEGTY